MSHIRPHTKKVQICSTSPGYPVYCPKCNFTNILIFYDPRFTPRLQTKWDNLIDEKGFYLKTGGKRSRMRTDGASQKRIQRNQTGSARIAMTEE